MLDGSCAIHEDHYCQGAAALGMRLSWEVTDDIQGRPGDETDHGAGVPTGDRSDEAGKPPPLWQRGRAFLLVIARRSR